MTATPHKEGRTMDLLHADLAPRAAGRRVAWLTEEPEADRRMQAGRRRRQRRRLTRTTRAHARQAGHEQGVPMT
jgi:hypothetical protein